MVYVVQHEETNAILGIYTDMDEGLHQCFNAIDEYKSMFKCKQFELDQTYSMFSEVI